MDVEVTDAIDFSSFFARKWPATADPGLLFSKGAVPGSEVQDWSMRKSIGEGKSGAARLILEAAVELDLRDEEVACISLQLRAFDQATMFTNTSCRNGRHAAQTMR